MENCLLGGRAEGGGGDESWSLGSCAYTLGSGLSFLVGVSAYPMWRVYPAASAGTAGDMGRVLDWNAAAEVDGWRLSAILGAVAVTFLRAFSPAAAALLLGWDIVSRFPSVMGPDTILGGGDCDDGVVDPDAKRAYSGVGADTL